MPATYRADGAVSVWVDHRSGWVIDAERRIDTTATVAFSRGPLPLGEPVASGATAATPQARDAAVAAARGETSASDDRAAMQPGGAWCSASWPLWACSRGTAAVAGRGGDKPERDLTAAE